MARPPRLERGTLCLEGRCSIQLSYGRTKLLFKDLRFAKNLILRRDTGYVKTAKKGDGQVWQKTPYANLIRYKPSKTYFARIRIGGKLIRRSLKTTVLVTTFSCRQRMGRTPLVSPISATSCSSEVPGLAKQVSNPASTRAFNSACAPFVYLVCFVCLVFAAPVKSRAGHSASPRDSQASRYLPPVWALVSDSSTLSREKLPAF